MGGRGKPVICIGAAFYRLPGASKSKTIGKGAASVIGEAWPREESREELGGLSPP